MYASIHPSIHPCNIVYVCLFKHAHVNSNMPVCIFRHTRKNNRSYEGAKRVLTPKEGSVSRMSETSAIMSAGSVRVWMRAHSYGNMWLCLYVCVCVWIWICILDTDIRTHTHRFFANTVGALVWNPMDVVKQKQQANVAVCAQAVLASFACVCARACVCACVRVVLVYGYKWILPCVCAVCGGACCVCGP